MHGRVLLLLTSSNIYPFPTFHLSQIVSSLESPPVFLVNVEPSTVAIVCFLPLITLCEEYLPGVNMYGVTVAMDTASRHLVSSDLRLNPSSGPAVEYFNLPVLLTPSQTEACVQTLFCLDGHGLSCSVPPSRDSFDLHSTGRNSTCSVVRSEKCFSSIFLAASLILHISRYKTMTPSKLLFIKPST